MDLFNKIFRDDIENSLDVFIIGVYNDIVFYEKYINNYDKMEYLDFLNGD